MSEEEMQRAEILGRVKAGQWSLKEAAGRLGVSYRQTKRLWGRYRAQGAKGLVHGNVGRPSPRAKPEQVRERALELVRKHYSGDPGERFGPTLAAEHLGTDHGLQVDHETLRRWMLAEGLWSRERKRKPYRRRRPRREHFGELLQLDGSFHEWLEERGPRGCLVSLVDDATGVTLSRLAAEETTWAVAGVLRAWVERYGIPRAIYADWKNVYQHQPSQEQQGRGERAVSQFGQMCARLGIELIGASSPQAKGRVERNHGTHQDRLIKKLRLRKVRDYEQANRFLEEVYLPQHNARYAVKPAQPVDFHEALPRGLNLEDVFCLEHERVVSNDWVVRYQSRWLQISRESGRHVPAGAKVTVREQEDGRLRLLHQGRVLEWQQVPLPVKSAPVASKPPRGVRRKPAPDHPWRRGFAVAPPTPPKLRESRMTVGERGLAAPFPHTPIPRHTRGDISIELREGTF